MQNSMKGVSRTLLGEPIPYKELLPPYKAWSYLVRNELAHGVGRRMYYTDEIGTPYGRTFSQHTGWTSGMQCSAHFWHQQSCFAKCTF